jgi:cobalt/nickel transport system permease protein
VAGGLTGQLLLRSIERSDRVYNAMLARGFIGDFQTLNPHHLQSFDWIFSAAALALMFALLGFSRLAVP